MLHFSAPPYAAGAVDEMTSIFWQELLKSGIFAQIELIPHGTGSAEEALWLARSARCDLVMQSAIVYLLDGSGAQPTRIRVSTRILDVRTGTALWVLGQEALSQPGQDIDLFWTTISGKPAQRASTLAKTLAEQFVGTLISR